jgi:rhodanese-related sulfurtransferase
LLVVLVGVLFALAANHLSPRGLSLTRNYFPSAGPTQGAAGTVVRESPANIIVRGNRTNAVVQGTPTNAVVREKPEKAVVPGNPPNAVVQEKPENAVVRASPASVPNQTPQEALAAQIKARGLQLAVSNQVVAWFNDPRRQTRQLVFIDARNEEDFQKGHVPGAWLFDPYQPERYFAAVTPVCQAAEQIVVYCHGGDCDDSLTAASLLEDLGIPGAKIAIYGGGMTEWPATGLPVETGAQNSGHLQKAAP